MGLSNIDYPNEKRWREEAFRDRIMNRMGRMETHLATIHKLLLDDDYRAECKERMEKMKMEE